MLLLLLYFLLLCVVFAVFGSLANRLLKVSEHLHPVYVLVSGMFFYSLFVWIILFFTGFNLWWQISTFAIAILIFLWDKKTQKPVREFVAHIKSWQKKYRLLWIVFLLFVLFQSTAISSLPDNFSYYIQTIKWANEFGFVPGLMNLHPFLGQFSAWHILQSGINFGFFNDINGFLLLLILFFSFDKLHDLEKNNAINWLVFLPLSSLLFLPFLDSPSPDLAIILLSQLVFYLFISNYRHPEKNTIVILAIITFFSILIKLTALPNLILLLVIIFKYKRYFDFRFRQIFVLFFVSIFFLFAKNYILTGYVFYPFSLGNTVLQPDWQYPLSIMQYLSELGNREAFSLHFNQYVFSDFIKWILQPGWHKLINISFVFMLIVFPFFLKNKSNRKAFFFIYLLGLSYFLAILFYAPNFRFFLQFYVFLFLVLISIILKRKYLNFALIAGTAFFVLLFLGLFKTTNISLLQFVIPQDVSSIKHIDYFKDKIENLDYYRFLDDKDYFWETGDAPLPSVQKNQIDYFKYNFHFIPQLRSHNLRSGFYAKKTN